MWKVAFGTVMSIFSIFAMWLCQLYLLTWAYSKFLQARYYTMSGKKEASSIYTCITLTNVNTGFVVSGSNHRDTSACYKIRKFNPTHEHRYHVAQLLTPQTPQCGGRRAYGAQNYGIIFSLKI